MLVAVAVLASLAFIGWLVFRAVRQKTVRAHMVSYALASLAGIYTYAFFLNMDISKLIKIVVSLLLGAALIVLAAYLQRRRVAKPEPK
jgi:tryptophan-rich sensory protein